MKYIRFKNRGFVAFEETQTHKDFAAMVGDEVVSAGFLRATEWCDEGKPICEGQSLGLGVSSRSEDTARIRRELARL